MVWWEALEDFESIFVPTSLPDTGMRRIIVFVTVRLLRPLSSDDFIDVCEVVAKAQCWRNVSVRAHRAPISGCIGDLSVGVGLNPTNWYKAVKPIASYVFLQPHPLAQRKIGSFT